MIFTDLYKKIRPKKDDMKNKEAPMKIVSLHCALVGRWWEGQKMSISVLILAYIGWGLKIKV